MLMLLVLGLLLLAEPLLDLRYLFPSSTVTAIVLVLVNEGLSALLSLSKLLPSFTAERFSFELTFLFLAEDDLLDLFWTDFSLRASFLVIFLEDFFLLLDEERLDFDVERLGLFPLDPERLIFLDFRLDFFLLEC